MRRFAALAVVVVSVAMVLVGCQSIAEKAAETAVEQSSGVNIDKQGDTVTIEGKDGEKATLGGEGSEVPAAMPKDVPIYPDAKITSTLEAGEGTQVNLQVTMETSDDPKTVDEWYVSELEGAGWTIDTKVENAGSYVIVASKASSQVQVAVAKPADVTIISLAVTPKQ